ncbi:MAG: ADP-ribosylglycohydrolase family protein [Chloroflexota bacterium]
MISASASTPPASRSAWSAAASSVVNRKAASPRGRRGARQQVPDALCAVCAVGDITFGPTDDAEQAALAAEVLLDPGYDPATDELFDGWFRRVDPQRDALRGSIAHRSAIQNAGLGLRAPTTGNDNPHHYDESSVARYVLVGIRWSGEPERASRIAHRLASIINAGVGIDGAAAFAAAAAAASCFASSSWSVQIVDVSRKIVTRRKRPGALDRALR